MKLTDLLDLSDGIGIDRDMVLSVSTLGPYIQIRTSEMRRVFAGRQARQDGSIYRVEIDGVDFFATTPGFDYREVTL